MGGLVQGEGARGGRIEVIRAGLSRESCECDTPGHAPQYGCWFYSAIGSGVFLSAGATRYFPTKEEAMEQLPAEYARLHGGLPEASEEAADKWDDSLAPLAYGLGYDTVQSGYSRFRISEVIATGRSACAVPVGWG